MSTGLYLPVDLRRFRCRDGSFYPNGSLEFHGYHENPLGSKWRDVDTWSALLFVGLSVEDEETGEIVNAFSVDDIIDYVTEVRLTQTGGDDIGTPDASFITQRGVFRHSDGPIAKEDSVQIIIIFTKPKRKSKNPERTSKKFESNMLDLASFLSKEFDQESVIAQIQHNGLVTSTGAYFWVD